MESNLELQKDKGTSLIHFLQLQVQTVTVLRTGQQTLTREYGVLYLKYPVMSGTPNILGYPNYWVNPNYLYYSALLHIQILVQLCTLWRVFSNSSSSKLTILPWGLFVCKASALSGQSADFSSQFHNEFFFLKTCIENSFLAPPLPRS